MDLYNKLPTSRSIRVLTLKTPTAATGDNSGGLTQDVESLGSSTQAVYCEMSVVLLTETESFDALSYVWGDPSVKERSMICNDHQVDITYNLHAALTQVWRNWPDKRLWVDAICINQNDIPERNQQVTMMGAIYRMAERVVVWLGESTVKSDDFFTRIEGETTKDTTISKRGRVDDIGVLSREILYRPWFERSWTLQEIQLAKQAIICCGHLYAEFDLFLRAIKKYNDQQIEESYCGGDILQVPIIPPSDEDGTLFYHLAETSTRLATDPRDKLYCLLSLLPKELYDFIEADYSLSVQETIIWASIICIELDEETGCLADAGLAYQEDKTLPSWALDWRIRHDYDHRHKYKRIGHLKTDAELLHLRNSRGRALDRVNRQIKIRGGGLGRLEVDKENLSARLSVFPECAIRWLGPPPSSVPCWVELPDDAFVGFCKIVKQHDEEKCNCLEGVSREEYPLRNLPRGASEGDWLWQRAYAEGNLDFVLRPVEGDGEPNFQLVGEAWGQGLRGPYTRLRVPVRHPEIKAVVATFILV